MSVQVHHGDCLDHMRAMIADGVQVDAVVTDPPYLIDFMGKSWDSKDGIAGKPDVWRLALQILKPGGHLVAFGGSRTYHRMVCAIEDAGFEIRDQLQWLYGSGFPKSLDVSKAIDKAAGAERDVVGRKRNNKGDSGTQTYAALGAFSQSKFSDITAPATDAARQWAGFGTALKPAHEPIVLARKPLAEPTVAANVLAHGTGALNIDACRVTCDPADLGDPNRFASTKSGDGTWNATDGGIFDAGRRGGWINGVPSGRWPANVVHDGSDEVLQAFARFGEKGGGFGKRGAGGQNGIYSPIAGTMQAVGFGDTGTAARFFYSAKASAKDRAGSKHPTVKPVSLMRWLVRLVTPPGGTVLDPFAGSGTTGQAALEEGFRAVLIEREAEYVADIIARIDATRDALAAAKAGAPPQMRLAL